LNRILLALRCFFNILFRGALSAEALSDLKLARREAAPGPKGRPPPGPARTPADGALQILTILQRDSRLVDFLMEDIASYSDGQVGAAVRELHDQCRDSMARPVTLQPVIDGVEGTPATSPSGDPRVIRFIGYVPHEELAGFLAAADVYVSTSTTDGASVSLDEAMACELAPVVTDIPANRAWIKDGENGFRRESGAHQLAKNAGGLFLVFVLGLLQAFAAEIVAREIFFLHAVIDGCNRLLEDRKSDV
jgi:hypothetical protein